MTRAFEHRFWKMVGDAQLSVTSGIFLSTGDPNGSRRIRGIAWAPRTNSHSRVHTAEKPQYPCPTFRPGSLFSIPRPCRAHVQIQP